MPSDPPALDDLSRDELIAKARQLGAARPELLTRPELRDEIIRLSELDAVERQRARGWFGVARDLVASVVSQGLHLSDTAELIRGVNLRSPKAGPPVATVTLAEIYAAQGHVTKALSLLDQVLEREPDHEAARLARQRLAPEVAKAVPVMPPEPEEDPVEEQGDTAFREEEERTVPSGGTSIEFVREQLPAVPKVELPSPEDDALFVVFEDGRAPVCLWQLGRRTVARLRQGAGAVLAMKVLEIQSSWDGPSSRESLLLLEGDSGRRGLESAADELRVVLGLLDGGRFRPLGVGAHFFWSPSNGATLEWTPPGGPSREAWIERGQGRLRSLLGDLAADF